MCIETFVLLQVNVIPIKHGAMMKWIHVGLWKNRLQSQAESREAGSDLYD